MQDFECIGESKGIKNESIIEMIHCPYDEKSAREQVYRLRELLDKPLDQCYVSSSNIEKVYDRKNKNFPSLMAAIEYEFPGSMKSVSIPPEFEEILPEPSTWNELALALDIDQEINTVNSVLGRSVIGSDKKKSQSKQSFDSRIVFDPEAPISMEPLGQLIQHSQIQVHRCVQSIAFSGWNPPPPHRKMVGDLYYLEIKTIEGDLHHVTANSNGFYLNGSTNELFDPNPLVKKGKQSSTLLGLLWDLSPYSRREFPRLMLARVRRHVFDVSPVPFQIPQWVGFPPNHNHSLSRVEDFMCNMMGVDWRMQQREWNEEYQSCRELPARNFEETIIRDRTIFKIHCDFVEAAIRGAKAVIERNIMPINPLDPKPAQVFIQNNIFFSFALDDDLGEDRELLKAFDLDKDAYSKASNDLKGVIAFNSVNKEKIHTLATTIVDYRGYRVVAQSLIPGILQGDQGSKHIYGNVEEKIEDEQATLLRSVPLKPSDIQLKKGFAWNEEFHNMIKKTTSKLYVQEHKIIGPDGKEYIFACPSESKGIVGSDGRNYILDLVGIFPKDTNFFDQETAFFRTEFMDAYSLSKNGFNHQNTEAEISKDSNLQKFESKNENDNLIEHQDKSADEDSNLNSNELQAKRLEFMKEILSSERKTPEIHFNPNIFSSKIKLAESKETIEEMEKQIRDLSTYMTNELIPSFVEDAKNLEIIPLDGINLTFHMHNAGINMRYLGMIADKSEKESVTFLEKLAQQEMIVRCAKHEFNRMLRRTSNEHLAKSIECFLNALLSRKEYSTSGKKKKKAIQTIVEEIEYVEGKLPVITSSLLQKKLIENISKKFKYTMKTKIFQELPRLATLRSFCLRIGLKILCRDYDFSSKTPFQSTDILDLQPIVRHSSADSMSAFKLMEAGREQMENGQIEKSFECISQAMIIFQQVKGGLNQEVSECFNLLAALLFQVSDLGQAILHQHKAYLICRRVDGIDNSNLVQMHQLLGMLCKHLGKNELALKHFYRAKYFCELICGFDNPDLPVIESHIATVIQTDPETSLKFLERALKKNRELLGDSHISVSKTYHSMALAYSSLRDYTNALQCEKESNVILKNLYGSSHARTQESSKYLEIFSTRMIEQHRYLSSKK